MTHETAILIAGPTASGKSALALDYARQQNSVIINADSMQVYRDLRVLTARPSKADEAATPHALYGHVAGADGYSAGRYCVDVAKAVATATKAGARPIIVGGTGLYFRALLQGLSPIPAIPAEIRAYWRARGDDIGASGLHKELSVRDQEMAQRLRPSDPQRLLRALEVLEATGLSLAYWQRQPGVPVLQEGHTTRLVLMPDRDELYRRCDERFDDMMLVGGGAVAEVRELIKLELDPGLPIMRALGVGPIADYLRGTIKREEASERAKTETRQFAKRQLTWLRKNMMSWNAASTQ